MSVNTKAASYFWPLSPTKLFCKNLLSTEIFSWSLVHYRGKNIYFFFPKKHDEFFTLKKQRDAKFHDNFYFNERFCNIYSSQVRNNSSSFICEAAESIIPSILTRQGRGVLWSEKAGSGACLTSKGEFGYCTTFKECYPYFKIPDLGALDGWVLGFYDTCSFIRENGRMGFGVCCSTNPLGGSPSFPGSGPVIEDSQVKICFFT